MTFVIMGKSEECQDGQDWIGIIDFSITQPHIAKKLHEYLVQLRLQSMVQGLISV